MTVHPKIECVEFFNICPKRAVLKKFKFDHSFCRLLSSSPVPQKKLKTIL